MHLYPKKPDHKKWEFWEFLKQRANKIVHFQLQSAVENQAKLA